MKDLRAVFRWLSPVVAAAISLELASLMGLWLSPRLLGHEFRTSRAILEEQSESIGRLWSPGSREVVDSLLGWRYAANPSPEQGINEQGVRSLRVYDSVPPEGVIRVAAFGDSFVFGNEVAAAETWTRRLEIRFPGLEVLNYGVGGYGTDQAFLRYLREGDDLAPEHLLIGFAPVDFLRIENRYRRFLADREIPLGKPRFVLDASGALELLPNPLPDYAAYQQLLDDPRSVLAIGEQDRWYRPWVYEMKGHDRLATLRLGAGLFRRIERRFWDPDRLLEDDVFNVASSAFALQAAVLATFADSARSHGRTSTIVVLPDEDAVGRMRAGLPPNYQPLLDWLTAQDIPWIDIGEGLMDAGPEESLWAPGGHYSPAGNDRVAAYLGPLLLDLGLSSTRQGFGEFPQSLPYRPTYRRTVASIE